AEPVAAGGAERGDGDEAGSGHSGPAATSTAARGGGSCPLLRVPERVRRLLVGTPVIVRAPERRLRAHRGTPPSGPCGVRALGLAVVRLGRRTSSQVPA